MIERRENQYHVKVLVLSDNLDKFYNHQRNSRYEVSLPVFKNNTRREILYLREAM